MPYQFFKKVLLSISTSSILIQIRITSIPLPYNTQIFRIKSVFYLDKSLFYYFEEVKKLENVTKLKMVDDNLLYAYILTISILNRCLFKNFIIHPIRLRHRVHRYKSQLLSQQQALSPPTRRYIRRYTQVWSKITSLFVSRFLAARSELVVPVSLSSYRIGWNMRSFSRET